MTTKTMTMFITCPTDTITVSNVLAMVLSLAKERINLNRRNMRVTWLSERRLSEKIMVNDVAVIKIRSNFGLTTYKRGPSS
eukprot:07339_4